MRRGEKYICFKYDPNQELVCRFIYDTKGWTEAWLKTCQGERKLCQMSRDNPAYEYDVNIAANCFGEGQNITESQYNAYDPALSGIANGIIVENGQWGVWYDDKTFKTELKKKK